MSRAAELEAAVLAALHCAGRRGLSGTMLRRVVPELINYGTGQGSTVLRNLQRKALIEALLPGGVKAWGTSKAYRLTPAGIRTVSGMRGDAA